MSKDRMSFFGVVKEISKEYYNYRHRICCVCGIVVPKGEGYISHGSFDIMCDDCFNKQGRNE